MKFKKGQSGNPNGRPPGTKTMTDALRSLLDRKVWPFDKTARELVILRLFHEGFSHGDVKALQYMFDRLDGKPAQAVELTGDEKRPLRIIYAKGSEGADS